MVELGLGTQPFELDESVERRKEMIGLRGHGARRRLVERSVLFE